MKIPGKLLPLLSFAIGLQQSALAVDFFWDGNDTTTDADGGSGIWDAGTTANWDSAATLGTSLVWPSSSSGNDDAIFGGTAGTIVIDAGGVTANSLTFNIGGYTLGGGAITLDGTTPGITTAGDTTISSVIAGSAGLLKSGAASLTLSAANTYTGATTLAGGTLILSGGNNRLVTTGVMSFSANSTLNLGGNSQTLANLTVNATSANTTATLTNGSLTLNGASNLDINPGVTTGGRTALVDATALSSLTISKASNNINVGGFAGGTSPGNYGTFRLSSTTNSITAANINVGTTGGFNAGGVLNRGELYLGASNTIYANNWTLGNTRDSGLVQFQNDLTNPSVTLRATDGTSRVTKITIGQNGAGSTGVGTSHFNLGAGSVDALVNELVISRGASGSPNGPAVNGSFSMGGGTLDATTIWLSKNESGGLNANTSSFNQSAGTVKVSSLVFGETTTLTGTPTFNSQYTLTSGELRAVEIKAGNGTFNTGSTRRINFNGGTITHYDESTDLLINGKSGTGGSIGLALGTAGTPTIHADTDRTVTLGSFTAVSGSGSLTKTGAGTLAINSASTYTGSTTINGGTVTLGGADRLPTGTSLTLANTAGVLLNLNNNNQTLGSLSGGGTNGGNVAIGTATLKVGNANNTTFSGQLTGTGSLVKVGTGSLTLSGNTTASLTGLNISGGTLVVTSGSYTITGSAAASAPDSTSGFIVSRGGTFRLNGGNVTATGGSYVITSGNTGGGGNQFILDSGTFDGGNREVLNSFGGTGTFTMNGGLFIGGEFRISQSATGSVNLNGGTLRVANLKYSNATAIVNFDGGTLQAKANRTDFITSSVTEANIKAGGATIDSNGFDITIPKALTADTNSPGGGLTKSGSGTLTLTAANTYTGTTRITGGTLSLTGAGAIASSSTIIVGVNTTLDVSNVTGGFSLASGQTISGPGTVAGAMTVSGTLSPGSSPGTLATGSQTWLDGGDYNWQFLDASGLAGTGYDTIAITGTLDLSSLTDGGFNINLWSLAATGPDVNGDALNFLSSNTYSWTLVSTTDGITGFDSGSFAINLGANNGTSGFTNDPDGGLFSVSVSGNNLMLNFSPVPEPAAALLAAIGSLVMLRRRR
jgi:fibronectin-binding autotransporter adhesin